MRSAHFLNRQDAGRQLAKIVSHYQEEDTIVFALPRGGIPVGVEVARELGAPLQLIITRKIGHPNHSEYAIGAVSEHGKPIYNQAEIRRVSKKWLEDEETRLREEIKRRRQAYDIPHTSTDSLEGKTAIIVDDGIATGYTMLAAIDDVKVRRPTKIVVAIPVVPDSLAEKLETLVDEVIALDRTQYYLGAVGAYYSNFDQLSDEDVLEWMKRV